MAFAWRVVGSLLARASHDARTHHHQLLAQMSLLNTFQHAFGHTIHSTAGYGTLQAASSRSCNALRSFTSLHQHNTRLVHHKWGHHAPWQRWYSAGPSTQAAKPRTGVRPAVMYAGVGLTLLTGGGLVYFFQQQRDARRQELLARDVAVVGEAKVGGPFELINQHGKRFTDRDLHGEFALLYFGFTFCPDICPDELEKIAAAVDIVEKATGVKVQPVFISVDPERDNVRQVKEYVAEFHPRLIGLTGSQDKVKSVARAYRVYYSKTADSPDDYLVDHSIITYLIDPEGKFVTFYGKNWELQDLADSIARHVRAWGEQHPAYGSKLLKKS